MTSAPPRARTVRALLAAALVALFWASAPTAASAAAEHGTSGATPPGSAWVRVGHFVPGMGAASIELQPIGGSGAPVTLAGSATYGQVSDYQKVTPGSYTATVRDSSATAGSAPMLSRSIDITADEARTVAVVGTAAAPRLDVLTDDLTSPQPGTARVRVLSGVGPGAVTVKAVDGPTIASDAVLGQATAYATVPAGSWTLQLEGASSTASLQDVPVASGSVYTVVVLDADDQADQSDDAPVKLLAVTDAAGAASAPKGGARTGEGGTAAAAQVTDHGTHLWLLGGSTALLAVGAVVCGRRRRPVSDPGAVR